MKYLIPLLLLIAGAAQAQTSGLAMRCDSITKATQAASCSGSRTWVTPKTGDYIESYPSIPVNATTVAWNDANLQFREWSSIPVSYGIGVCTKPLTSAQVTIPAGGVDQCAPGADAVLKPFVVKSSVGVTPAYTRTVTLNWTAPTANSDGSALTPLTGYNIYMGATASQLLQVASITNPGLLTWTSAPLSTGTYFFTITALNSSTESAQSAPPVSFPVAAPKTAPGAPTGVKATGN